jgi:hypothetical protein
MSSRILTISMYGSFINVLAWWSRSPNFPVIRTIFVRLLILQAQSNSCNVPSFDWYNACKSDIFLLGPWRSWTTMKETYLPWPLTTKLHQGMLLVRLLVFAPLLTTAPVRRCHGQEPRGQLVIESAQRRTLTSAWQASCNMLRSR